MPSQASGWGGVRRIGRLAAAPAQEPIQLALGITAIGTIGATVAFALVGEERREGSGNRRRRVATGAHRCPPDVAALGASREF